MGEVPPKLSDFLRFSQGMQSSPAPSLPKNISIAKLVRTKALRCYV